MRESAGHGCSPARNRLHPHRQQRVSFRFRGKRGQDHEVELNDRRLARIIRRCHDLPGHELFQYVDEDGEICRIDSTGVNQYLKEIAGDEFTAKEFRAWAGRC